MTTDELMDREAIRQLPIAYAHHVWTENLDELVALFTVDGEYRGPPGTTHSGMARGHEALRALYASGMARAPRPFIHQHHIGFVEEGSAEGHVYLELRLGSEEYRVQAIGVYEDRYLKTSAGWRFQSRLLSTTKVAG